MLPVHIGMGVIPSLQSSAVYSTEMASKHEWEQNVNGLQGKFKVSLTKCVFCAAGGHQGPYRFFSRA